MDEIIRNCFNHNTVVNLKNYRLEINSLIAEGGFGYVFKVRDVKSNTKYALKRLSAADKQAHAEIRNEIDILQQLQPHRHIMKFVAWDKFAENAYFLLCEFCGKGCLTDLKMPLTNYNQIYRIIYQTSLAISHMHKNNITHRDIKAENVLFDDNGIVKICDFGSATTEKHYPSLDWVRLQRSTVEDEMQRHTTPMYRAPEILETYLNYPIDGSMDVWALGCLVYFIRFGQHAFPDSGKLAIVNCRFNIPKELSSDSICIVINQCLKADPRERISIDTLVESLKIDSPTNLEGPVVPESECQPNEPHVDNLPDFKEPEIENPTVGPTNQPDSSPKTATTDESNNLVGEIDSQMSNSPSKSPTTYVDKLAELLDYTPLISDTHPFDHSLPNSGGSNVDLLLGMEDVKDDVIPTPLSPQKVSPSVIEINNDRKNQQQMSTKDMFEDLLPDFKRSTALNDIKAPIGLRSNSSLEDCLGFDIDSNLMKIDEWKESRRGNIRALLSSLHTVLTDDFKWRPIGMHQLIAEKDVKKVYRDACLLLHPDKVHDEHARETAKVIFMELNEAWQKFEKKR